MIRFTCSLVLLVIANTNAVAVTLDELQSIIGEELDAPVRSYSTRDFGREYYTDAISVLVSAKKAQSSLSRLRDVLPSGAIAFLGTTRNLSDDEVIGVELVVIASDDKFDILRASQTDGINYGLTNAQLIEKLKEWDELYGVDIWHAETDTIELKLTRLPDDIIAFSKEIYEFCPDIVDQGSGRIGDIADYLEQSKSIYLWWD